LRVWVAGCRVQGSEFRVQGSGFRVQGSGFRIQGSGFTAHQGGGAEDLRPDVVGNSDAAGNSDVW
jgi:hypothetical protein